MRPGVSHALAYREKYNQDCASFLAQHLDSYYKTFRTRPWAGFVSRLDIMVGKRNDTTHARRFIIFPTSHRSSSSTAPIFPGSTRSRRRPTKSATNSSRSSRAEEGFTPYISYPQDVPQNQFAELNNSPRWSAFHLYKMGERIDENAAKCPKTMKRAGGRAQAGSARAYARRDVFAAQAQDPHSAAQRRDQYPPGHAPRRSIIPEGCGFRVGNDTRQWVPGKAWVFDDTIEHEAWNDSDKLRVVLIFDIWHPHLTPPERAMITAMTAGLNAFPGDSAGF